MPLLKATKLNIRHVPGTGRPSSFDLIGNVGAFASPSDFRVKGQPVNAGGPGVVFVIGTAANLLNARVNIHGTRVVNGVLTAANVTFERRSGRGGGSGCGLQNVETPTAG